MSSPPSLASAPSVVALADVVALALVEFVVASVSSSVAAELDPQAHSVAASERLKRPSGQGERVTARILDTVA